MPKLSSTRLTKAVIEKTAASTFVSDAVVRGLGLRVSATGRRSFVVTYRIRSGGQGRTTLGTFPNLTVDQAREEARKVLAIVERGGHPSQERRADREAATVADLASYYCGGYAQAEKLKAGTIRDASSLLERFVLSSLGSKKVAEVTPIEIRKVQSAALEGAGHYQANKLLAVLGRMFTLAIGEKWRVDNPCMGLKKYPEDQRHRHLDEDEIRRLLLACDRYGDQHAADAIRLLLFTGARLREVLKATWDQFDLERGVWLKPSSHTKTQRQHVLELEGPALAILTSMRGRATKSILLFPGRCGTKPRADVKHPWETVVRLAGISNVRPHDLRRTLASVMLSEGAALATVGKTLGHTQPATTARYAHLSPSVQRRELSLAGHKMASLRSGVQPSDLLMAQADSRTEPMRSDAVDGGVS